MTSRFLNPQSNNDNKQTTSSRFLNPIKQNPTINEAMMKRFPSMRAVQGVTVQQATPNKPASMSETRDSLKELGAEVPFATTRKGIARNTLKGLPQGFAEAVGDPALRAYAGINSAITGRPLTPETDFQKDLYGTDEALTAERAGRELVGENAPAIVAAPVGFTLGALDLFGGGSAVRGYSGIYKGLRGLTRAGEAVDNIDDARVILKNGGISDTLINQGKLDELLTSAKTNKEVDTVFKQAATGEANLRNAAAERIKQGVDNVEGSTQKAPTPPRSVDGSPSRTTPATPSRLSSSVSQQSTPQPQTPTPTRLPVSRVSDITFRLENAKDAIIQRLQKIAPVSSRSGKLNKEVVDSDEYTESVEDYINRIGEKTDKTLTQSDINEGIQLLRVSGREVDDIVSDLSQIGRSEDSVPIANTRLQNYRDGNPNSQAGFARNPLSSGLKQSPRVNNQNVSSANNSTPTPGAKAQTPRFAQGADSMFEGADIAEQAGKNTPRSTAALSKQAQDLIRTLDESELDEVMRRNDDLGTAVTAEYLNKLARDYSNATTAADKTAAATKAAKIATEKADSLYAAGKQIQAASLLSRLTPEGQLRSIVGDIKKYNQGKPKKKQVPELTEKQLGEILEEMDDIRRTVDPTERQIKFHKLQRKTQAFIPSTNLQKITNAWKAGLLTGIKTLGLNVFSNVSHLSLELTKDIPANAVDWAASLVTHERKIALTGRGIVGGLGEGTSKGIRYFHTGFDERNIGQKLDYKRVNYGNGPVGKKLQWYTDKIFQTIGATDQPMYYAALRHSYMSQALAEAGNQGFKGKARVKRAYEIVENPTEEMMEAAVRDAQIAIFTNDTKLGEMAKALQNMKYIGQFLVPFRQTPSAVATQIFNYTPTGAVAEVVGQIRRGKFDQKAFSEAMGRSITGTAPVYIGWELANSGLVSLDYPQGDSRQIELDKAEGIEYNSIKVGDEWRNPIVLGPAGNLLLLGAHINIAMEKSGSTWEGVHLGARGMWDSFKEQTFLTGLSTFVSVVDDLTGRGQSAFQGFISSFIPTIVSDVARSTDTVEREVSGSVGERIKSRIPGARQTLEPKVDVLGREIMISGRGGEILPDFLESMVDPTRPSQDVSTPVTMELNRLMNEDLRVAPTRNGLYDYEVLTDKQETQLQKYAGQMINENLNMLFQSEQYRNSIDEDKADTIEDIVKYSKDTARARMVLEILAVVPQNQRAKAIQRMDADGLITRDVARILDGT